MIIKHIHCIERGIPHQGVFLLSLQSVGFQCVWEHLEDLEKRIPSLHPQSFCFMGLGQNPGMSGMFKCDTDATGWRTHLENHCCGVHAASPSVVCACHEPTLVYEIEPYLLCYPHWPETIHLCALVSSHSKYHSFTLDHVNCLNNIY